MSELDPHCIEHLSEYIDSVLVEKDRLPIEKHLAACTDCAHHYQELLHIRKALRENPVLTPPHQFYDQVLQKIDATKLRARLRKPFAVLLTLVVFGGLAALWMVRKRTVLISTTATDGALNTGNNAVSKVEEEFTNKDGREFSSSEKSLTGPTDTNSYANLTSSPSSQVALLPGASVQLSSQGIVPSTAPVTVVQKPIRPAPGKKKLVVPHGTTHQVKTPTKTPAPSHKDVKPVIVERIPAPPEKRVISSPVRTPARESKPSIAVHFPTVDEKVAPSALVEWKGDNSGFKKRKTLVVLSQASMKDLWTKHAPGTPVPDVDFSLYMVVAVTLGQTHASGLGIEIVGTRSTSDAFIVYYREAGNLFKNQATLHAYTPYHFKVLPKTNLPVQIQKI